MATLQDRTTVEMEQALQNGFSLSWLQQIKDQVPGAEEELAHDPTLGAIHRRPAGRVAQPDPADPRRHSPRGRAAVLGLHLPRQEGSVGLQPDQAVPGSRLAAVVPRPPTSRGRRCARCPMTSRQPSASWPPSSLMWSSSPPTCRAGSSRRCRRITTRCGCSCSPR